MVQGARPALALVVAALAILGMSGCGGSPASVGAGLAARGAPGRYPYRVVATHGMLGEAVREIVGAHAEVAVLMGPGVDPHLYKPSPGDIAKLSQADIVFHHGLHLEGKMAELLERFGRAKPIVAAAEALPAEKLRHEAGLPDPHVWFDVTLWMEVVAANRDALAKFDPTHAKDYADNAARYLARLEALDKEIRAELASIPASRRVLVTAHDAFGYFGRAYAFEVRAVQGINTEAEAAVKEVNELVDFLVKTKTPAVFVESSVPPRNVQAIVEGCQARGHRVRVGGELYSDAMGPTNSGADDYIGMARHNARTIVSALCQP